MTEKKEFNNENLSVTLTQEPECKVSLHVEVKPEQVAKSYEKALKTVNKEVSLPGFRKGKAPKQLLQQHFQSSIDEQWKENVVSDAFYETLKLTKLNPEDKDSVERPKMQSCSKEDGASIDFVFECSPDAPTIDIQSIQAKKPKVKEVTEEQRSKEYHYLRTLQADWKNIEDKDAKVEAGNRVTLNIEVTGSAPDVASKELDLLVEPDTDIWLHKELVGMKVGETKETKETPLPKDKGPENLNNRLFFSLLNQPCRFTVNHILKRDEQELTDEIAQSFGAKDLADLKERIEKVILTQNEEEARLLWEQEIQKELMEKYPLELPRSKLNKEKEIILKNMLVYCKRLGLNDSFLQSNQPLLTELAEERAKRHLTLFYLFRELPGEAHRQITQDQMVKELQNQLSFLPHSHRRIDNEMPQEEMHRKLAVIVFERNGMAHIMNELSHDEKAEAPKVEG